MKILDGRELASYIKNRQLKEVSTLSVNYKKVPKLAIIQLKNDPIIDIYVRLKKKYGQDIGINVANHNIKQAEVFNLINKLNEDQAVDGIIVQLPVEDPSQTDKILNSVSLSKDVDALVKGTSFDPATPTAILWLLAGYNIELNDKQILIIGNGKLVGQPLSKMLIDSGQKVIVADINTNDLSKLSLSSDVIITATGRPGVLKSSMIKPGCVVVDAGVATDNGKTVGDLDANVYKRQDITVTPIKGGVGPLTICALFANVIKSAQGKVIHSS